MKRIYKIFLSLLSGLLLAAAWPEHGFPFFLFVAFIPLLIVENDHWNRRSENHGSGFFWYGFLAFILFNILTPTGFIMQLLLLCWLPCSSIHC
jgi:apolipoprotein N-acyltransferase